jgi:tetratricopeptide (TPR) repeat protein
MSRSEVEESRDLYQWLTKDEEKQSALSDAFNKARAYTYIQPDLSKLTRAQVDAELPLIQDCLRLSSDDMQALYKIAEDHIDFSPGPSAAEIREALRITYKEDPSKDFPAAYAFTQHDTDKALALEKADEPAIEFAKEFTEQGAGHLQEAYEKIHARYPDFKPEESKVRGFGYTTMGNGDLPRAIEFFQLAVKLYPKSWNVYDDLGEAYVKSGKKKLAIENYQHAHQLNPTAPGPIAALKKLQK